MPYTIDKSTAQKINAKVQFELQQDEDAELDIRTFKLSESGEAIHFIVLHPEGKHYWRAVDCSIVG